MSKSVICSVSVIVMLVMVGGCKNIATFNVSPYPGVNLSATIQRLSYHEFEAIKGTTTFVHFKYIVAVDSDIPVYFKVENTAVEINGVTNNGAYYDTYISIAPHWRQLKEGENIIEAYASFPGMIDSTAIQAIKFTNYGLSREVTKANRSLYDYTHSNAFNSDLRAAARLSAG